MSFLWVKIVLIGVLVLVCIPVSTGPPITTWWDTRAEDETCVDCVLAIQGQYERLGRNTSIEYGFNGEGAHVWIEEKDFPIECIAQDQKSYTQERQSFQYRSEFVTLREGGYLIDSP